MAVKSIWRKTPSMFESEFTYGKHAAGGGNKCSNEREIYNNAKPEIAAHWSNIILVIRIKGKFGWHLKVKY